MIRLFVTFASHLCLGKPDTSSSTYPRLPISPCKRSQMQTSRPAFAAEESCLSSSKVSSALPEVNPINKQEVQATHVKIEKWVINLCNLHQLQRSLQFGRLHLDKSGRL